MMDFAGGIVRPLRRGRAGRRSTIATAIAAIPDGARIYVAGGSAVPTTVLEEMTAGRSQWSSIEFISDYLVEPLPVFQHPGQPFRMASLQPSGALAAMIEADMFTTAAAPLRQWSQIMAPGGAFAIDVAIVHVSPPGPDGHYSLGVSAATPLNAMVSADLVIGQINPQMPYVFGAAEVHADEFDFLCEADHPLVEFPPARPDDATRTIGALVAGLTPNGAILQLGLGALPEVVCAELTNHRDLGIHSGMVSDGLVDLHRSGAITGATHPDHRGKMVTGLAGGTRKLFDFVDRNPELVTVSTTESHGLEAISRLKNFIAINSAIEVALDGSINSERVGERIVSGPGGAPDYAEATALSEGGRFIVALPSTAAKGRASRIVPTLSTPATVPGHLVDTVVTEHGVADLRDLSPEGKAEALKAIAHPDFATTLDA